MHNGPVVTQSTMFLAEKGRHLFSEKSMKEGIFLFVCSMFLAEKGRYLLSEEEDEERYFPFRLFLEKGN